MSNLRDEIEQLLKPIKQELDKRYAGEEEDHDHEAILDEVESLMGEEFRMIGYLRGVINGAGISWTLDVNYYMLDRPLSDGKTRVLFGLWYDDNWCRWQFDDVGKLELPGASEDRAAYELLKQYAEPGSDRESIEDCEDLIEEWRCAAEGLPRPKSRRDIRMDERAAAVLDRLSPDRPSERDAKFTEEEMKAVLHALVMVAKADDVLAPQERDLLETLARDLSVPPAYIFRVADMMVANAIPLFMFKVLGSLKNMREAKKVWVAQFMHIVALVDGDHDEKEKEVWGAVCSSIGIDFDGGIDPFQDLPVMAGAVNNIDRAWAYRPSWPFMPLCVECLDHGDASGPIEAVNEAGVLILWMRLVGQAKRLEVRLAYREENFQLKVSLNGVQEEGWQASFEDVPRFGDILCLLTGDGRSRRLERVQAAAPLGQLLGGALDVRDWNPKDLGGTVTKRVEFDDDEQADGKGILSRVFGKKARRTLEFSCNYHVPPKAFVRFLEGKVPSGEW